MFPFRPILVAWTAGKSPTLDAIDGRTRDHPCRPRPGDTAGVSHRGDPEEGPRHRRAATARCSAPGRSTDVLLRREYTTPSDPARASRCPCGSAPVGPAAGGPSDHPHPLRGRRGDREPDPGAPSRESAAHTGLTFRYCRIFFTGREMTSFPLFSSDSTRICILHCGPSVDCHSRSLSIHRSPTPPSPATVACRSNALRHPDSARP